MPKVSICIPAYKEPEFLRRTLQSVFIQSFEDFEVIITDDSPDESVWNVVKEFSKTKKIKYFKNKERKGSPENWNEAVRKASGEYVKFLHHDDWFSNQDSLSSFVMMLDANPQASFAFSASNICDVNQNIQSVNSPSPGVQRELKENYMNLFTGNIIGAPSATIFKRSIHQTFDPNLKWVVDIDFYMRVLKETETFGFSEKALVNTTNGASHQVTRGCENNKDLELFEWFYLFNKNFNGFFPRYSTVDVFWKLIRRFNVQAISEIRNIKKGKLKTIFLVQIMIFFNKLIFMLKRIVATSPHAKQ